VHIWKTVYFVSYRQKFYCSFQQTQAANFKVRLYQQSYRTRRPVCLQTQV